MLRTQNTCFAFALDLTFPSPISIPLFSCSLWVILDQHKSQSEGWMNGWIHCPTFKKISYQCLITLSISLYFKLSAFLRLFVFFFKLPSLLFLPSFLFLSLLFFFSFFYSFHIFFSQSGCNLKQNQRLGSWNDLGKISSTFWKVVEDSLGCIIFSGRVEGDFFTLFSTSEWIYFWFIFNCGCFFYVNMVTENYNLSFHKH